jgi:hypothetical protein
MGAHKMAEADAEMSLAEKREMLVKMIDGRDRILEAIATLCAAIRRDEESDSEKAVQQIQEIEGEQWEASRRSARVC